MIILERKHEATERVEWNEGPMNPLLCPVRPLFGQAIFTSLGLFPPLKVEVWITQTRSFRWPGTVWRRAVNSVLPSRTEQERQWGVSALLSLQSAITGGFSNTSHLLFEPQHHPTSLQVRDPLSASLLWQSDTHCTSATLPHPSTQGRPTSGQQVEVRWGGNQRCRRTTPTLGNLSVPQPEKSCSFLIKNVTEPCEQKSPQQNNRPLEKHFFSSSINTNDYKILNTSKDKDSHAVGTTSVRDTYLSVWNLFFSGNCLIHTGGSSPVHTTRPKPHICRGLLWGGGLSVLFFST